MLMEAIESIEASVNSCSRFPGKCDSPHPQGTMPPCCIPCHRSSLTCISLPWGQCPCVAAPDLGIHCACQPSQFQQPSWFQPLRSNQSELVTCFAGACMLQGSWHVACVLLSDSGDRGALGKNRSCRRLGASSSVASVRLSSHYSPDIADLL